jgi:hypothetical protein
MLKYVRVNFLYGPFYLLLLGRGERMSPKRGQCGGLGAGTAGG